MSDQEMIPMSLRFHITLLLKKENLSITAVSKKLKTDKKLVEKAMKQLESEGKVKYSGNRKWQLIQS